jgi:hypothetical protein
MFSKLLVFAYPQEAEFFIRYFNAKHFYQLKNIQCLFSEKDKIYILITGSGSIAVSVAISSFFERNEELKNSTVCFNIGIAGSYSKPLYEVFYASKITNYHNLKSFYPDIFISAKYSEIMSIEFPANKEIMQEYPDAMFDMESFAFANTAKYYVENHCIHCIKFISDNDGTIKDMFELIQQYENKCNEIINLLNSISVIINKYFQQNKNENLSKKIDALCKQLPLTFAQQQQLIKASHYFVQKNSFEKLIQITSKYNFDSVLIKKEKNLLFKNLLKELYNV